MTVKVISVPTAYPLYLLQNFILFRKKGNAIVIHISFTGKWKER